MKTEQEILERIEHIKTLSNGYGINERRIKELEWVIKPSKLSQHEVSGQSEQLVCDENKLDCPYEFTSRCTMGRCDCKPKQTNCH